MKIQPIKGKKATTYRVQIMRNGKKLTKTFKTKKEAQLFSAKMAVDENLADAVTNPVLTRTTLSEAISEHLSRWQGKDRNHPRNLERWAEVYGDKPLGSIKWHHVRDQLERWEAFKNYAPATLNRLKAALSSLYREMDDRHRIQGYNPAREVRQRREPPPVDRYLTDNECARLLEACQQSEWDRLYLLVLMAITTGARREELTGLRWRDINLRQRVAQLKTSKNNQPRVMPLTTDVINELRRFIGVGLDNYPIFALPETPEIPHYHFQKQWYDALKRSGVKQFRFHDLRHTCGSWLAQNGATLTLIKDTLGHKTIVTTQRYIHHSIDDKAREIARAFGNLPSVQRA